MSTADAMATIAKMSGEEKAELDKLLSDVPAWVPQPGPQSVAYYSEADILFYGGAAGGGKSSLLLGSALTSHQRSIVFRREAVQLTGLEEDMTRILGSRTGYNSQSGVWRLPGGRVMELGSVAQPDDWMKYQGRAHDLKCVGRGTPVLMADGTHLPIESVSVGDMVETLEGPRTVTRLIPMRRDRAIRVTVDGFTQVQSLTHELLTLQGWVSLGKSGVSPPPCSFGPMEVNCDQQSSVPTPKKFLGQEQLLCNHMPGQRPVAALALQSLQVLQGSCAASEPIDQEIYSGSSSCQLSEDERHFSVIVHPAPQLLAPELSSQECIQNLCAHGAGCVSCGSLFPSYLEHCSSGNGLCDAQLLLLWRPSTESTCDQASTLQPIGVGQPNPSCFASDAQDETQTHTHSIRTYAHPYTKEIRRIVGDTKAFHVSWEILDEDVDLFDLTVDDVNHYITGKGLINKNCFDELAHFTEGQFRALIGWLRSDDPNQRQRVICAGNPPTSSDGQWVKRFWAPWLDPTHANPAKPGELRWFVTDENGDDMEVPSGDPVKVGPDTYTPKSRTFVPSSVDDNLFLSSTGYKATLQSLPEPLRSQMLRGDFNAGVSDPAWQLIPTEWVKAAQSRWVKRDAKGEMTALGFDPARGGADKSTAARRHGQWFDSLVSVPGAVTDDGPKAAGFVVPLIRNGACICVDAIGIGSSALDFIRGLNLLVLPVVGSASSGLSDKAGQLRFRNKRAEMYWLMREALDPTSPDPIALPPDQELLADLCAVRYKVVSLGKVAAIQIRDKDEIREVLGRSPDKGDAVAMTFVSGIPQPASLRTYSPPPPPDWRM